MISGLNTMIMSGANERTASSIGCGSAPARKSMKHGRIRAVGDVRAAARKYVSCPTNATRAGAPGGGTGYGCARAGCKAQVR
jgi:hypothetical protein